MLALYTGDEREQEDGRSKQFLVKESADVVKSTFEPFLAQAYPN